MFRWYFTVLTHTLNIWVASAACDATTFARRCNYFPIDHRSCYPLTVSSIQINLHQLIIQINVPAITTHFLEKQCRWYIIMHWCNRTGVQLFCIVGDRLYHMHFSHVYNSWMSPSVDDSSYHCSSNCYILNIYTWSTYVKKDEVNTPTYAHETHDRQTLSSICVIRL